MNSVLVGQGSMKCIVLQDKGIVDRMCSVLSCLTQYQHVAPPPQDRKFMTHQTEQFEMELQRLLEQQKDEMKTLELHFLDARQEHKRSEHTHTHTHGSS